MRYFLLFFFVCFQLYSFSQTAPLKYWVQFTDKNNSSYSLTEPLEFLSPAAVERRNKFGISIEELDLPVNEAYVSEVSSIDGLEIVHSSKWFNAVTIQVIDSNLINTVLPLLDELSYVAEIKSVQQYVNTDKVEESRFKSNDFIETYTNSYGPSYGQISVHNGQLLHELGLRGNGMKIGVFDSGFTGINYLSAFEKLRDDNRIKLQHDVVDNDNSVLNGGNHGKSVLSILAGYMPDSLIGSAPEADYYLFRTEDGASETITEEDNWVRAMEMADSIGIHVVNSSLGYTQFDDPTQNHTYADMNGNTTRISIAADIAASKGILVVNSAGNSGDDPWFYIGAPADADSILAVGAIAVDSTFAWFSSRGPSSDGDVKPNVCGVGYQTVYADLSDGVSKGNGTSFSSPVIAGLSACLWQAFPHKSNMEILKAIEESSNLYSNPNDSLGHGIPNYFLAYQNLLPHEELENNTLFAYPNPFSDELNIVIEIDEIDEISIIDYQGREVMKIPEVSIGVGGMTVRLDKELGSLPSGSYTVILYKDETLVSSLKLLKTAN